jgi:cholesterol oxidase
LRLVGVTRSPDLPAGSQRWTIASGTLNVLIDDPRTVDTKLLVYRFRMTNTAGDRVLWFRGHKVVNIRTLRRDPWLALTRIPFVVYDVDPDESRDQALDLCAPAGLSKKERALDVLGAVETWDSTRNAEDFLAEDRQRQAHIVGAGVVRSTVSDAIRLSLSMRVTHDRNALRRLRWRWRYNKFFFSTVIPLRVWALRRTRRINPYDPQENFRIDKTTLADPIHDNEDRPRFSVTRYLGAAPRDATRGPVMLAPGFGMSTLAFHAAGADSFAEYLHRLGYDVWLFDYRASDKLDVSLEQFDIDVLATQDFPDAIETVYEEVNRPRVKRGLEPMKVRVVAHCLASMTMQMGLLAGAIKTELVHSMLLSQSFAFIDLPWQTRLKVRLHLPELLTYLNFRMVVTSDFDVRSGMGTRLLDRLLYFFPSKERCHEGVCRRLLLLYGEVVRHDNLDQRTHEIFYHLFDRGNLAAFKHIGRMFIRGHISDRDGRNAYLLPKNGKLVNIPITLLQGAANNMFRPAGARKTRAWLVKHGPFGTENEEMFTLVETPGYGHLDSFIGRNAARDVFPVIAGALERMGERVPVSA